MNKVSAQPSAPGRQTRDTLSAADRPSWVMVGDSIALPEAEYQARFGALPIDEFRARMSPEVFAVFMRFTGVIPGSPDLDIVRAARLPAE